MNLGVKPSVVYAKGRKRSASIIDVIVTCLQLRHQNNEGAVSLRQLIKDVRKELGFEVPDSSVRAAIYKHRSLFMLVKRHQRQAYYALSGERR